ncbi:MAG: trigger factor [Nitrospinae bacterium CG11_big_fil_rev_8_21_14_0_20_56_8]|nr:MAG: trigger factor [Nitrospinae bacterium CG11_big_fil_rev_8_21_14_0_20_56_8]
MDIEIEDVDTCNKKIKFTIPHADYLGKVNSYYKTLGRDLNVPGFRKGKVPTAILEKRFGPEVKREVLTQLISDRVNDVIQEKDLRAISQPHLLDVQAEEGTDITVTATVEILPPFEMKDVSAIELNLKIKRVTEEAVDKAIDIYRDRHMVSHPATDRPAQNADFLKLDFKGLIDGKPFHGGEAADYVVQLGQGQLIPGMEEPLIGMGVGEEKMVTVNLPETHPDSNLAGKEVEFRVHLKSIHTKELPEVTDDFARKADPRRNFKDIPDMREQVRKELEDYERRLAKKSAKQDLAKSITGQNTIELPPRLIDEQIRYMVQDEKKKEHTHDHLHEEGEEHDHSGEETPVTAEDKKKHMEKAVQILREEFLLDKLATDHNIEVSEKELNREIQSLAQLMGGGDIEKLKREWAKSGLLARLYSRMRRDKTLEALLDKVVLKEEMVDSRENIPDN